MSAYAVTVTYIPFLLIVGYVLTSEIIRFIRYRGSFMLILMAASVLVWSICMLAVVFVADNVGLTTFLWNIALAFISLSMISQLFVIRNVFFPEYRFALWIILLFFAMPVLNAIVAITPSLSHLIREVEVVSTYPSHVVNNNRGTWFLIHTIHSYALVIITVTTLIRGYARRPKFYRLSSYLIIAGICLAFLGNVLTLTGVTPFGVDATALAAALATLFYYLAMTSSDQNIYIRNARNRVFNHMDDYVLILGESGHIADFNPEAAKWFSSVGIKDLRAKTLQAVLDFLVEKGAVITDSPNADSSRDIEFEHDGFPAVFNLRIDEMVDKKRYLHGSIAFFSNVTQNRALLNRLEKEAGMDSLTGLANRVAFDGAKARLDDSFYLPLGVFVCDVNFLKETNDSLGHKYGDMLLQTVAEILSKVCSKEHFLARIGGDEFVMLLPKTSEEQALAILADIQKGMASYVELPFKLSLAIGMSVKTKASESLDDLITKADMLMYEDKKRTKESL